MAARVLIWIVAHSTWYLPGSCSIKSFFDLGLDFQSKGVQPLGEVANFLQKMVVEDHRWDGSEKTRGGGDQRLGDARSDCAQTGGAGAAQAGKRVDDAPHGSEQTDEGGHRTGCRQPGHAFFDAAHFIGGGKLHADGDGLQAFQLGWMRVARGGAHLALQFAVARRIDGSKRRARRCQGLRVRYASGGAKNAQELVALAADASEEAKLLENHGPGNNREQKKKQ